MSFNEKQTILVIDDARSINEFIQTMLEDQGYSAVCTENGNEALPLAIEHRPDLILLDIMMPDIDGYTVCAQLKAEPKTKDIPVIFLSALNSSFDKVKAFKCGAVDFVTKPVQNDELMARVTTHLTISSLHRTLIACNRDLEDKIRERTQNLETENENLRRLNSIMEQTLLKYKAEAEQAEAKGKLKRNFLEEIRSELSTPLQSISDASAEISAGNLNDETIKAYAQTISSNSHFVGSCCDKIINYSLSKTSAINPVATNVDVSQLLKEIVSQREPKDIQLILKDNLDTQKVFFTDREMLSQILANLIDNAIEFTKEGSVEVNASYSNDCFVFCIKDTGIGIHPEKMDIIFNPLAEPGKMSTPGYAFTTIGLALVKEYVDALQGEIWFDSTPGKGTEFYVSLPAETLTKPHEQRIFENKSVLVGDDDDVSYILLHEVLKPTGIKIRRAKDGRELFEMFRQNPVPLVITNLKLPIMNGTEVLKMIKMVKPDTVAIAQMPYFSAVDKRDYSASICDGFIERPAKQEQILEVLKKHLADK
ncbi:MAG: response regulator [Bacteroidales bacterium]|nr:response regulator [Bacteroidales bacterium]